VISVSMPVLTPSSCYSIGPLLVLKISFFR
jgi:hypothetical protein